MSALSLAKQSFSTFHSNTTAIPVEITSQIIGYAIADTQLLPMGGGVGMRRAHHPVASVSGALRMIYLSLPYPTTAKHKATAPIHLNIGEALYFNDLRTLAAFFREGPGRDSALLPKVRFLSISYLDDHAATYSWRRTTDYAYEAFELLYTSWHLMQVSWLHLCLPCLDAISSVDDPGLWSLLKIRGLTHLTISGPHGCIVPRVRAWLKARTRKKKLFPWQPLGVENPGPNNWTALIKHRDDQPPWQQQYEWLNAQYKYLHDRETVTARRIKQRAAYHKRRRRWPMLSKRRKKRSHP
jgi:hypothetical protein